MTLVTNTGSYTLTGKETLEEWYKLHFSGVLIFYNGSVWCPTTRVLRPTSLVFFFFNHSYIAVLRLFCTLYALHNRKMLSSINVIKSWIMKFEERSSTENICPFGSCEVFAPVKIYWPVLDAVAQDPCRSMRNKLRLCVT